MDDFEKRCEQFVADVGTAVRIKSQASILLCAVVAVEMKDGRVFEGKLIVNSEQVFVVDDHEEGLQYLRYDETRDLNAV